MNDKIFINDIEVFAKHGIFPEEKKSDQRFLLSVSAHFNPSKAMLSDDIAHTVNYAELLETIVTATKNSSFNLVERLAKHIADEVFNKFFEIISAEITIKKFPKDISNVQFSAIGFSSTFYRDEK